MAPVLVRLFSTISVISEVTEKSRLEIIRNSRQALPDHAAHRSHFFGSACSLADPCACRSNRELDPHVTSSDPRDVKNNCRAISDPRCDPSFRYRPSMGNFSESSWAPGPTCAHGQSQTMPSSRVLAAQDRPSVADRNAIPSEISADHQRHHSARSEVRNKAVRLPAMPIDVSALSDHLRGTVLNAREPDSWIAKALKPRKSSRWQSKMDRTTSKLSY